MKQWTLFLILLAVVLPLRAAHALPPCNTYVDTSEESVMGVNTSRVERCNDASIYPAAENNYCLNIHGDHYPTVPICALNTAKTACIPRLPSEVQADRCPISRQLGQCEGACPQPARAQTIEQEVIKLNAPRLQIPLITLQPFTGSIRDFKLAHQVKEGDKTFLVIDYLANYLAAMYSFLISIAGIVAGIMIIWAGVKWLTSAGAPDRISDAKKKIADAAVGLVLILSSYTILHIVNPDLVFFKPLRVQTIERIELTLEEQEEEFPEAGETGGGAVVTGNICNSVDACREICNKPINTWPTSGTNSPDPKTLLAIPTIAGLSTSAGCSGGCISKPELVTALERAAQLAQAAPGGPYTIKVTSATRTVREQLQLVCNKINCLGGNADCVDNNSYKPEKLGVAIGWPGNPTSGHGRGLGVDVALLDSRGTVISCSGCYDAQGDPRWAAGAKKLFDIMVQAGFKRYCKEIWHFEYASTIPCRSNQIPADKINVISCSPTVCP